MKSEPDASSREPDEVLSGIVSVRAFACEVPSVKFGLVGFVTSTGALKQNEYQRIISRANRVHL